MKTLLLPLFVLLSSVKMASAYDYSAWQVSESVDEIHGTKVVMIYKNTSKSHYPDWKGDITLNFRDKGGRMEAWVSYPGTFLDNEDIDIVYRIDDETPMRLKCGVSSDYQAAWIDNGWWFAKQLAGREKLVVRVQPYGESPITCTFELEGMAEAFRPFKFHEKYK